MINSIRNQLALLICSLILAALLLALTISHLLMSSDYEVKMKHNNAVMAESLSTNITQFIYHAYSTSQYIAAYPELAAMPAEKQHELMLEMIRRHSFFQLMATHDLAGNQMARSSGPLGNRAERFWFKKFMQDKNAYISNAYYSVSSEMPIITIVHGLYSQGALTGVLMSDIGIQDIQEMLEHYTLGEGSYAYVLDGNGAVISHPDKRQVSELYNYKTMTKQALLHDSQGKVATDEKNNAILQAQGLEVAPSLQNIVRQVMSGESGEGEYTEANGEAYICAYRPLPLPGASEPWSLIVVQRKSAAMAFMSAATFRSGFAGLIVIALSVLVVGWFSRKITQPLIGMVKATERIKLGDLDVRLPMCSTNNEIGMLSTDFNQMVEELRQHRDNLNLLVEQRTGELATAHQKLLLRERQYSAITALLVQPVDKTQDIFETILHNAVQLLGAVCGYIGMYENNGLSYYIRYAIGIDKTRFREEKPAQEGMQGQVYATGDLFYVDDYRVYPDRVVNPWIGDAATTVIMVPLKLDGQVRGILAVNWVDEVHPISRDDLDSLRQFGDLASVALERDVVQQKISTMAYHDVLTGLPNRAGLRRYLEAEMEKSRDGQTAGVVLFIDMDDLKSINDNFGHSLGDKVIVAAGRHIVEAVGQNAFVSRVGGDEFVVVISGVAARTVAERIANETIRTVCKEYEVGGDKFHMSASIGVAVYPDDANETEDILKKADSAMYAAKKAGRNCWRFYEPTLLQEAYEKMTLTNGLRRALERNELLLHYQPQVAAESEKIIGFEALLRWNSAEYGMMPPNRFIPLAEQSGLIVPIGQWVVQEACRFARRLADSGRKDVRVAVNISPRQLRMDDFVDDICASINAAGIEPRQLEVEITESVFIDSMAECVQKLLRLQAFGVGISLDDFGTGYSSLTYLRSLPVGVLKIDKSFIDKIIAEEMQLQVVGAIVNLGHTLGMTVVAEGVETKEQLALLQTCRCDLIQGYVFSRPVVEAMAMEMLKN